MNATDAGLWPMDELMEMDEFTFDQTVGDTREWIEETRAEIQRIRRKMQDGDVHTRRAGARIVRRLEELLDTEVRNLQRFAFAFEARQGRSMV